MLRIGEVKFITSAADKKGFYGGEKPVIAVCGKSNVGKSSFINMLANRRQLARASAEPGRTRLVNYFDFGAFVLADLPGYGFAHVAKSEKERWARLLDDFFAEGRVSHVFALADIRHEPTADDRTMIDFLYYTQTPFTVIATKCDKLSRAQLTKRRAEIANAIGVGTGNVFLISSLKKTGKEDILARIDALTEAWSADCAEE